MATPAQYLGTGKRKTSVARVILRPGDGDTWINGKKIEEYFPRQVHRMLATAPLKTAGLEGQYDLNVEITRSATGMALVFRYDTDLFDEATVARLVATYVRLLEVAVTEPSTKVGRVPLMDDAERARVLALGAG